MNLQVLPTVTETEILSDNKEGLKANEIITFENLENLQRLFKDEETYIENMQSLRIVRKGLEKIIVDKPHLKADIMPQLHIINELIGALYSENADHPF